MRGHVGDGRQLGLEGRAVMRPALSPRAIPSGGLEWYQGDWSLALGAAGARLWRGEDWYIFRGPEVGTATSWRWEPER